MKYEIIGDAFPAVKCHLEQGEAMKCEGGSMSWMDRGITMSTEGGGGLGKALSRAVSGESIFFNHFACTVPQAEIAFASSFPGRIIPVELAQGQSIIAQKTAFLACEDSVDVAMHFHKKVGSGVFGGMGFIMQKFTGPGTVFLEIHGGLESYELAAGEEKVIDGPHLAILGNGVEFEIETVKGMKNKLLGGEGLFNTVVRGPGKVWLQTIPVPVVASAIEPYLSKTE